MSVWEWCKLAFMGLAASVAITATIGGLVWILAKPPASAVAPADASPSRLR
jgi:hypothetical protein